MENEDKQLTSPFATYRAEILGGYGTAAYLRALVMNLWNGNYHVSLSNLFSNADERHIWIAMELIRAYTEHGERDPVFMALAAEIRETFKREMKFAK